MPERSTGGPTSTYDSARLAWCWCVRVDFASPVGTKRFTDGGPAGDLPANVDGAGVQTWSVVPLVASGLEEGNPGTLSVATLAFGNLDGQWTTWKNTVRLLNTPVQVWKVDFDPDTGAITNLYKKYDGRIDNRQLGMWMQLVLKPHHSSWAREAPWLTPTQLGAGDLMPDPSAPAYYGDQLASNANRMPVSPQAVGGGGKRHG